MTGQFEPIFPAHAIERCSASVTFAQPVTDKFLTDLGSAFAPTLAQFGIYPVSGASRQLAIGLEFGPNGFVQKSINQFAFSTLDGALTLTIAPHILLLQTNAYVRWKPFIGQFEELAGPIIERMAQIVPITMTKLDYVDRFFWTGDWSDLDYTQLIRSGSPLLAPKMLATQREWHNHVGWFEGLPDRRRLFNVNIDVVESVRAGHEKPLPTVGILTMAQDQPLPDGTPVSWPDLRTLLANFDDHHIEVKKLFASLVTPDIADRISLNSPI